MLYTFIEVMLLLLYTFIAVMLLLIVKLNLEFRIFGMLWMRVKNQTDYNEIFIDN